MDNFEENRVMDLVDARSANFEIKPVRLIGYQGLNLFKSIGPRWLNYLITVIGFFMIAVFIYEGVVAHEERKSPDEAIFLFWFAGILIPGFIQLIENAGEESKKDEFLSEFNTRIKGKSHLGEPWYLDCIQYFEKQNGVQSQQKPFEGLVNLSFVVYVFGFLQILVFSNKGYLPWGWVAFDVFLLWASVVVPQPLTTWWRYLKFGQPELKFKQFPYWLGEKLEVELTNLPSGLKALKLKLRYIKEEKRILKFWFQSNCLQLHSDVQDLNGNELAGKTHLPVEFSLPANPEFANYFHHRKSRYWQLEVMGKRDSGVDYHARFVLPVYEKS